MRKKLKGALAILAMGLALSVAAATARQPAEAMPKEYWRALHVIGHEDDDGLERLLGQIPALAKMGINVLIFEVDYHFDYQSHPELRHREKNLTRKGAEKLSKLCRKEKIRLIPLFNCIGHQSWEKETFPLLKKHPEFDLTPGAFPDNVGIYCREWDVANPKVNAIVFALMDELLEAFQADAMHVGLDEVFLLGSEHSPSTKGEDPAKLLAKAINEFHAHLVKGKKVEMLMWADRLIDPKFKFNKNESAHNGTAKALDDISRDIILIPWHYGAMPEYPSIPEFLDRGFRVLPASWNRADASKALIDYSLARKHPRMLGHLFTVWSAKDYTRYPPLVANLPLLTQPRK